MIITGPTGVGKTFLAPVIADRVCRLVMNCLFCSPSVSSMGVRNSIIAGRKSSESALWTKASTSRRENSSDNALASHDVS